MSSTWASVVPAGTVPKDYPAILTASLAVLARRFRADPHEVGRIEGIGPDLWKPVSSSTMTSTSRAAPVRSSPRASDRQPVTPDGTISNPVSSSTRASVGRDARRSHRSVEGHEWCV